MEEMQYQDLVVQVAKAIEEKRVDEAFALLENAINESPENGMLHYMKGCAHREKGDVENAIEAFQRSANFAQAANDPKAALALYNLANIYKDIGDYANAMVTYQSTLEVDPTMNDAWVNLGYLLAETENHETAIDCYDASIHMDPDDAVTWNNRGNSLRALLRFDEAAESYQSALKLEENDFVAILGLGICQVELGQTDGLKLVEQAYATSKEPIALFELATLLVKLERHEEARECYGELVKKEFHEAPMWNNYGECLAQLNQIDEAINCFDKAIELDSNFESSYFGKARVLLNAERLNEAAPVAQQLAEIASDDFKSQASVQALFDMVGIDES